jgi:hypothetical protein
VLKLGAGIIFSVVLHFAFVQKGEKQKAEEMEEIAKLRKEAVHKANPIRHYKPLKIKTLDVELTDPHSPAFSYHSKRN